MEMKDYKIRLRMVPHDDYLDFYDAIMALPRRTLDVILVSVEIYLKLTRNGKWCRRNLTQDCKPLFEFEKFDSEWYRMRICGDTERRLESSIYSSEIVIYFVQFDNEQQVNIAIEQGK